MFKIKLLFLVAFTFLIFSGICQNNSTKKTKNRICVVNRHKPNRIKYFKENQRIKFRVKNISELQKGRITLIKDSAITINKTDYAIRDFTSISGRPLGLTISRIGGLAIATEGAYIAVEGIVLLNTIRNYDTYARFVLGVLGTFYIVGGTAIIIIGVVPLLIRMNTFDLINKWDIRVVH